VFEESRSVVAVLAGQLAAVEPDQLSMEAAAELLELAAEVEKVGAALRLLVARRAAAGPRWHEEGYRSPAAWVAAVSGSSVGEGRATLQASERLAELSGTREALRAGGLSSSQAEVVTTAAALDPASEPELLRAAATLSVEGLKSLAREVRAGALEADPERREQLRRRRYLRFWTDPDGLFHLSGALVGEAGAELFSAVRARAAFVADEAMAAGMPAEPPEAYDADALVALCVGDTRMATFSGNVGGTPRQATIVAHVSLEALRRGGLEEGECCEVPGLGPIPLATVEGLLGDAAVVVVASDDEEVSRVWDLGRVVPPNLRRALEERDPRCVVPGCTVSLSLITDLWRMPDTRERTGLSDLARLCRAHHRQKSIEGYALAGGPGRWEWRVPP
jgi:hypothetical protein